MHLNKITLLLLALLALAFLSWDYTSGHSFEDFVNLGYCPICDSFLSAEIAIFLLFILIFLGFVPEIKRLIASPVLLIPSLCVAAVTPDRAPPAHR